METVIDALKAMGKATYREIAARLDIEPMEALTMLREYEEQGLCHFLDGAWSVGTAKEQKPKRIRPKQTSPLVERVLSAMQGQGAMSANQVAEKLGKSPRALNASLGAMCKDGLVLRHVDGKNITWSLAGEPAKQPEQQEPAAAEAKAASAPESKTLEQIIGDIPAFASRQDDLIIPSSRYISTEIRRTKAKLANLQRLQVAVRELRRHKHLLEGLGND
ncbi:winged helix-turn-helix transcriptional regulator [Enterobacter asburiae]|uniref:winged helix-turn-helix transcriptional regulator n=1 Tax=Enterobacter asburiae TaxID=61645 RepID=UPI002FD64C87